GIEIDGFDPVAVYEAVGAAAIRALSGDGPTLVEAVVERFLPHTSERLHTFLGYKEPLFGEQFTESQNDNLGEHTVLRYNADKASGAWQVSALKGGEAIEQPEPLYKKLEPSVADEERARMG
ncbi:MAG: hypothetical protein IIC79_03170, partial [Chloroflexi bacterium]|nr:hypothetical protein [Chloroflexota bacterium]